MINYELNNFFLDHLACKKCKIWRGIIWGEGLHVVLLVTHSNIVIYPHWNPVIPEKIPLRYDTAEVVSFFNAKLQLFFSCMVPCAFPPLLSTSTIRALARTRTELWSTPAYDTGTVPRLPSLPQYPRKGLPPGAQIVTRTASVTRAPATRPAASARALPGRRAKMAFSPNSHRDFV